MSVGVKIDADFAARLFAAIRAGSLDMPGVTRTAYGDGEQMAHELVRREAEALGMATRTDAAGNLYATLAGSDPTLPPWIIGSHLDSVPHGGDYDGTAGVIAGLATVHALVKAGIRPRRAITVMAIRAEESCWFPVSYLGSRAAFGLLPAEALDTPRSDTGRPLRTHMAELGFAPDVVAAGTAQLTAANVHGFVELHIEQGPVLEAAGMSVGLVESVAGSFRYRRGRVLGRYDHSGAVPREHRRDAMFALAEFVMALDATWTALLDEGRRLTVTFGEVGTDPQMHGFSKVPGEVRFCLDVRSGSRQTLEFMHERVVALAEEIGARRGVRFDLGERSGSDPAELDLGLRSQLAAVASRNGLPTMILDSGAGHDVAVFANAGVPAALVFVRNQNGSHNPDEAMRIEDFAAAADLVLGMVAGEPA